MFSRTSSSSFFLLSALLFPCRSASSFFLSVFLLSLLLPFHRHFLPLFILPLPLLLLLLLFAHRHHTFLVSFLFFSSSGTTAPSRPNFPHTLLHSFLFLATLRQFLIPIVFKSSSNSLVHLPAVLLLALFLPFCQYFFFWHSYSIRPFGMST